MADDDVWAYSACKRYIVGQIVGLCTDTGSRRLTAQKRRALGQQQRLWVKVRLMEKRKATWSIIAAQNTIIREQTPRK